MGGCYFRDIILVDLSFVPFLPKKSCQGCWIFTFELCPPGTYSGVSHQTHIDNCTDCEQGYYCSERGGVTQTDMCDAGHICFKNALFATPVYNNDSSGGKSSRELWFMRTQSIQCLAPSGDFLNTKKLLSQGATWQSCFELKKTYNPGHISLGPPAPFQCWFSLLHGLLLRSSQHLGEVDSGWPKHFGRYCS